MSEQLLHEIMNKLTSIEDRMMSIEDRMATKEDIQEIKDKLDTIYSQVAHNTEQEVNLNEATSKIESLETDIKLIKRVLTNQ